MVCVLEKVTPWNNLDTCGPCRGGGRFGLGLGEDGGLELGKARGRFGLGLGEDGGLELGKARGCGLGLDLGKMAGSSWAKPEDVAS
jgi:hypothetical protein